MECAACHRAICFDVHENGLHAALSDLEDCRDALRFQRDELLSALRGVIADVRNLASGSVTQRESVIHASAILSKYT